MGSKEINTVILSELNKDVYNNRLVRVLFILGIDIGMVLSEDNP